MSLVSPSPLGSRSRLAAGSSGSWAPPTSPSAAGAPRAISSTDIRLPVGQSPDASLLPCLPSAAAQTSI